MSATDDLLRNNETYAEAFDKGELPGPPAKRVAVVSCMDARVVPSRILGLEEGDAHIIKNAGGVVTGDVIRSLAVSQHLMGSREVIVIQHTDCGLVRLTDDGFAERMEEASGQRPDWSLQAFTDLEESVRDGVERIRTSPFLPNTDSVRGFVYDVTTGRLAEVG
jgi:carbonic anhydrase